jgi:hypothetical protein
MFQLSCFDYKPVPEISVTVLGVVFQAFVDPETKQAVFSQSGVARALAVDEKTIRRWLRSKLFERLQSKAFSPGRLLTEVSTTPIVVVTQADLVVLVKIASRRGNAIASTMQDASFPVVLQQSVDEALGIDRPRSEYLVKGAMLRQRLEGDYLPSYHRLKDTAFKHKHGVRGLCMINSKVSSLAVPDADKRRKLNPHWRKHCNSDESAKLTMHNVVLTKAAKSSCGLESLEVNIEVAAQRCIQIQAIIDMPY